VELVVVVGIVSIFLVGALVWMHPKDYGGINRNSQRSLDTAHLLQVLVRYYADHGSLPDGVTDTPKVIGSQPDELDICKSIVPAYLKDLPRDPVSGGVLALTGQRCNEEDVFYSTGYTVAYKGGVLTIAAPDAEAKATISLSRRL
jgi:type II secretory pathway pseudopilin PulG